MRCEPLSGRAILDISDQPYTLAFVDDDPAEINDFEALYASPGFEIVGVHAPSVLEAPGAIQRALGGRTPDLFVLDMFLPASPDSPISLTRQSALIAQDAIDQAVLETSALTDHLEDGKALLRNTQAVISLLESTLRKWCSELGQSPANGVQLLTILNESFPSVPKLFYSRKATVEDVKLGIGAGAHDVIRKPPPRQAAALAPAILREFETACRKNRRDDTPPKSGGAE
ncbi:MAG: hypothetical protein O3A47_12235 [Chloroflexi bacterium]|nr:hypothetical protein [Chloroflexota bacterium]